MTLVYQNVQKHEQPLQRPKKSNNFKVRHSKKSSKQTVLIFICNYQIVFVKCNLKVHYPPPYEREV